MLRGGDWLKSQDPLQIFETFFITSSDFTELWNSKKYIFFKVYLVSYPEGSSEIKEWMFARLAASNTSSIDTTRLLSPYWIFSAIVRSNNVGS